MTDRAILTQPCCDCDAGTVVEILSADFEGREFKVKTPNGSAWLVFGDALERIPSEPSPALEAGGYARVKPYAYIPSVIRSAGVRPGALVRVLELGSLPPGTPTATIITTEGLLKIKATIYACDLVPDDGPPPGRTIWARLLGDSPV